MKSTKNIKVPEKIVDQVIGQEEAVKIIKKAALQRRHVLLIGEPGTGKSMLGLALAELLPKSSLKDILAIHNPNDENMPLIQEIPAGTGREEVKRSQLDTKQILKNNNFLLFILAIFTLIAPWWVRHYYKSDVMFAAFFIGGMLFLAAFAMMLSVGQRMFKNQQTIPPAKVIVDNFGKKQAPFYDATGSHAGALLGDCLHDPLQCFSGDTMLSHSRNKKTININKLVGSSISKYQDNVYRKEKHNYEAVFLPKGELTVLGETNNSISSVEVLSCNRHSHNGEMIKLTTSENQKLTVTPEHAVAIWKHGKISYVQANDVKVGDEVIAKAGDILIDEQDIINTYEKRQQEQCRLYGEYLKIKKENPTWGYKRISKALGEPIHRTRWWHHTNSIPVPIETANWLKERGLLPLKIDNKNLPLIAKVLGATFGDGGIFANLNAIFLSSSEREATDEFGDDLIKIFGEDIHNNSRTIEGGEYGNSWCYQNTNRGIIRLFKALGAPIGKKTNLEFHFPNWIPLSEKFEEEFFGSFLGNELGVPKVHKQGNRLDMLSIGISGTNKLIKNKENFLNHLCKYLFSKEIICTSISIRKGKTFGTKIVRLLISTKIDNVINFQKNIKINYCRYKQEKLSQTLKDFKEIKRKTYNSLIDKGYSAEHAMRLLQISPNFLYTILNEAQA